jgi:hypothetical protein
MSPLEAYLRELREIRATGAAQPETSFYGPLANLFNEVGASRKPKVRCVIQLANRGAGLPDGGLFSAEQFRSLDPAIVESRGRFTQLMHLILETKGFDPLEEIKGQAAQRWVAAVNADGSYGRWGYSAAHRISKITDLIELIASNPDPLTDIA